MRSVVSSDRPGAAWSVVTRLPPRAIFGSADRKGPAVRQKGSSRASTAGLPFPDDAVMGVVNGSSISTIIIILGRSRDDLSVIAAPARAVDGDPGARAVSGSRAETSF